MRDDQKDWDRELKLLAQVRAGDAAAWPALLTPLRALLLPTVSKWTKSRQQAEDIVQELLLIAVTKFDSFRGEARLSSWMWTVAKRETLNLLRDERRRQELLRDHATEVASTTGMDEVPSTPETTLLQREQVDTVQQEFQKLRPNEQATLRQAVLTQEEAQDDDNNTPSPAKIKERVALHRARQKLRVAVRKLEGTEDDR